MAAITDPKEVGNLLRAIDNFRGTVTVSAALKLSLMRRQEKLEAMLWGDKRKWWRKPKRERLLAEFERVAETYDNAFVLAAANLLGDAEMLRLLAS